MRKLFLPFTFILLFFLSFTYREHHINFNEMNNLTYGYFFSKENFLGREIFVPKLPEETIRELKESSLRDPELLPYLATAYIEDLNFKDAERSYLNYFQIKGDIYSLSLLLDFYHKRGFYEKEVKYLIEGTDLNLSEDKRRDLFKKAIGVCEKFLPHKWELKKEIYEKKVKNFSDYRDVEELVKLLKNKGCSAYENLEKITSNNWFLLYARLVDLLQEEKFEDFYTLFQENFSRDMPQFLIEYFYRKLFDLKGLKAKREDLQKKLLDGKYSFRDFSFLFYYLKYGVGKREADNFLRFYIEKKISDGETFNRSEKIALLKYSHSVDDYIYSFRILNSILSDGKLEVRDKIFSYRVLLDLFLNKNIEVGGINSGKLYFLVNGISGDNSIGSLNSIVSLLFNGKNVVNEFSDFKEGGVNYFALYISDEILSKIEKLDKKSYVDVLFDVLSNFGKVLPDSKKIEYLERLLSQIEDEKLRGKIYLKLARIYRNSSGKISSLKYYKLYLLKEVPSLVNESLGKSYWGIETEIGSSSVNYFEVVDEYVSFLLNLNKRYEILDIFSELFRKFPDKEELFFKFLDVLDRLNLIELEVKTYNSMLEKFKDDKSLYGRAVRFFYRLKRNERVKEIAEEFINRFDYQSLSTFLQSNIDGIRGVKDLKKELYRYALLKFPLSKRFLDKYAMNFDDGNLFFKYSLIYPDYCDKFLRGLSRKGELDAFYNSIQEENNSFLKEFFTTQVLLYRCEFEKGIPFAVNFLRKYYYLPHVSKRFITLLRSYSFKDDRYLKMAVISLKNYFLQERDDFSPLIEIADIYFENGDIRGAKNILYEIVKKFKYDRDVYVKVATVFWDYFLNEEAIKVLQMGRKVLKDDTLFSYELGGIYESKGDLKGALLSYLGGINSYNYLIFDRIHRIISKYPDYKILFEDELSKNILRKKDFSIFWSVKDFYTDFGNGNLKFEDFLRKFVKKCEDVDMLNKLDENFELKKDLKLDIYEKIFQINGGMYNLKNFKIFEKYIFSLTSDDGDRVKAIDLVRNFYERFFNIKEVADFSFDFFKDNKDFEDEKMVLEKSFEISKLKVFKREYGLKLLKLYLLRNDKEGKFLDLYKKLRNDFSGGNLYFEKLYRLYSDFLIKNREEKLLIDHINGYFKFSKVYSYDDRKKKRVEFLKHILDGLNSGKMGSFIIYEVSKRLILTDPENEKLLRYTYHLCENFEVINKLFEYFKNNFKNSPKDFRLSYALGYLYFLSGYSENSEYFFRKSIDIRPEYEKTYLKLINVLQNEDKKEREILNTYISLYNATRNDSYICDILRFSNKLNDRDIFSRYLNLYLKLFDESDKEFLKAKVYFDLKKYLAASKIAILNISKKLKNGDYRNLDALLNIFIKSAEYTGNYHVALITMTKLFYSSIGRYPYNVRYIFRRKLVDLLRDFYIYCDDDSLNALRGVSNLLYNLSLNNKNFLNMYGDIFYQFLELPKSTELLKKIGCPSNSSSWMFNTYFSRNLFSKGISCVRLLNSYKMDELDFMRGVISGDNFLILNSLSKKLRKSGNESVKKLYVKYLFREKDFNPGIFMSSDNFFLVKREFLKYMLEKRMFLRFVPQVFDRVFAGMDMRYKLQRSLLNFYLDGDFNYFKEDILPLLKIIPFKEAISGGIYGRDIYLNAKYTTFTGEIFVKKDDLYGYKLLPAIVERVPSRQNYMKLFNFYRSEGDVKRSRKILHLIQSRWGENFDLKFEKFLLAPVENLSGILKLARKDETFRYILVNRCFDVIESLKNIDISEDPDIKQLLKLIFLNITDKYKLMVFCEFLRDKGIDVKGFLKGEMFYKYFTLHKIKKLYDLRILKKDEVFKYMANFALKNGSVKDKFVAYIYLLEKNMENQKLYERLIKELKGKGKEYLSLYDDGENMLTSIDLTNFDSISYADLYSFLKFVNNPVGNDFSDERFLPFLESAKGERFKRAYIIFLRNVFKRKINTGDEDYYDYFQMGKSFLLSNNSTNAMNYFKRAIYFSLNKDQVRGDILKFILEKGSVKNYGEFIKKDILPYIRENEYYVLPLLRALLLLEDDSIYSVFLEEIKRVIPRDKLKIIDFIHRNVKSGKLNKLRILTLIENESDGYLKLLRLKLLGVEKYDSEISGNFYFLEYYYRYKFQKEMNDISLNIGFNLFFNRNWFKLFALNYWYNRGEYAKILSYFDYNLISSYVASTGYYYSTYKLLNFRNMLREKEKKTLDKIFVDSLLFFSYRDVAKMYLKSILPDGFDLFKKIKDRKKKKIVDYIMGEM